MQIYQFYAKRLGIVTILIGRGHCWKGTIYLGLSFFLLGSFLGVDALVYSVPEIQISVKSHSRKVVFDRVIFFGRKKWVELRHKIGQK